MEEEKKGEDVYQSEGDIVSAAVSSLSTPLGQYQKMQWILSNTNRHLSCFRIYNRK